MHDARRHRGQSLDTDDVLALRDLTSLCDELDRLAEALKHESEPTPAEPLTDAQIVARITAIIDNGRLAQMHQQMDDLTTALAQATQAREAAEHRAETLRSNMAALRDLISDEDVS